MTHAGNGWLAAMMISLAATGKGAMIALDRNHVTRAGARLALIMAAAIVGIVIWGMTLSATDATFTPTA